MYTIGNGLIMEETKMTLTEKTARRICTVGTWEREEAEKMMGVKLTDMTKEQFILAAECIAAFAQLGAFNYQLRGSKMSICKQAAVNLAETAGRWNDARRTGSNYETLDLWNKIYREKAALLQSMGFEVKPETDEDGYAVAVTVCGERAEVSGLFHC